MRRIAHHKMSESQRPVVLERDARVVLGWPDAHREQRRAERDLVMRQREDERAGAESDESPPLASNFAIA